MAFRKHLLKGVYYDDASNHWIMEQKYDRDSVHVTVDWSRGLEDKYVAKPTVDKIETKTRHFVMEDATTDERFELAWKYTDCIINIFSLHKNGRRDKKIHQLFVCNICIIILHSILNQHLYFICKYHPTLSREHRRQKEAERQKKRQRDNCDNDQYRASKRRRINKYDGNYRDKERQRGRNNHHRHHSISVYGTDKYAEYDHNLLAKPEREETMRPYGREKNGGYNNEAKGEREQRMRPADAQNDGYKNRNSQNQKEKRRQKPKNRQKKKKQKIYDDRVIVDLTIDD